MNYIVTAYKLNKEFDNRHDALDFFEKVKNNFTYCEVKEVSEEDGNYYSISIKIFYKK